MAEERVVDGGRGPALHSTTVRLGYADTDPAGILYYAAWFPWMERTQSEWFWLNGLRQDELKERHGFWTVTAHTACDYVEAVGLFDEIRVELRLGTVGRRSFEMLHRMVRTADDVVVARARIRIVTVSPDLGAVDIPPLLRRHLDTWAHGTRLAPAEVSS
ncbi:acyl-CoA thioesterase [Nocardioides albidus]|uniref:Acyl-CoA thioesterase n=1 Tax=Nocardioides albidus TaxID=1517589 RepID=A0A5C4W375_9ACTN|nr:acyl-CoA thioesterase [Nocardioides albidus]TNM41976.1 acyl-CoA thioesterase [Nocardioides albidus]